jgi:hypothetical protein
MKRPHRDDFFFQISGRNIPRQNIVAKYSGKHVTALSLVPELVEF